ncbi:MAG TPA: isochorismatase family cysteine hydrolase [Thermoplasmataceae archaeon]|nr:isochorismatase family cysteine hydrolase [Thermoplasmataceae archaeon]
MIDKTMSVGKTPPSELKACRTAAIVIDMQNDFVHPDGYVARKGGDVTPVIGTVQKIKSLLLELRNRSVRVIFTRTIHYQYSDSKVWLSRSAEKIRDSGICRPGTWGSEIIDELRPQENDIVIVKHRYDAFLGTDLEIILHSQGIENLLVVGTQTNACVDSTARHAFMIDINTIIVSDCVSTPDKDLHWPILQNFHKNFGYVADSAEVIKMIR